VSSASSRNDVTADVAISVSLSLLGVGDVAAVFRFPAIIPTVCYI
jgi:hypothetical protein